MRKQKESLTVRNCRIFWSGRPVKEYNSQVCHRPYTEFLHFPRILLSFERKGGKRIITGLITLQSFLICLATTMVLGMLTALVFSYKNGHTASFSLTLALIPIIVSLIIMMIRRGTWVYRWLFLEKSG